MANILDRFKEEIVADQDYTTLPKLKIGIIGTGWIAESHVVSYKRCPDIEIVAAADLVPGKAEAFCKANGLEGVRCYPDHQSMLDNEELDAVSVCTYNRTHAECTIAALKKGVNKLSLKVSSSAGNEFRRCFREELEPAGYFNTYAKRFTLYPVDDDKCGISNNITIYKERI